MIFWKQKPMLSTSKPFEIRRIQRSANDKLIAVSLFATFIAILPTLYLSIHLSDEILLSFVLGMIFLFLQCVVLLILYALGIGKLLLMLYFIPFMFLLKSICSTDEWKVLQSTHKIPKR